jgi:hypothetical protein
MAILADHPIRLLHIPTNLSFHLSVFPTPHTPPHDPSSYPMVEYSDLQYQRPIAERDVQSSDLVPLRM